MIQTKICIKFDQQYKVIISTRLIMDMGKWDVHGNWALGLRWNDEVFGALKI